MNRGVNTKSEVELQKHFEDQGNFVLRSCQSRTPIDLAVFDKKAGLFLQVKETIRNKVFLGNDIKKLDELDQSFNTDSVIAIKFKDKNGRYTWIFCPVGCLVKKNVVTISKDEPCCIKKEKLG